MVVKAPILDELAEGESAAMEKRKICNQVLMYLNLGGG